MSIRNFITQVFAHFTKPAPMHHTYLDFSGYTYSDKPWMNAHLVKITADDFKLANDQLDLQSSLS